MIIIFFFNMFKDKADNLSQGRVCNTEHLTFITNVYFKLYMLMLKVYEKRLLITLDYIIIRNRIEIYRNSAKYEKNVSAVNLTKTFDLTYFFLGLTQ